MRILVTRPVRDAEETAAKLIAHGHEAVIAPLLEIKLRSGAELSLANIQAVLATSANGVRALAPRTGRRDNPLLTVGAKSAQVARQFGFSNVRHADGDAAALADLAIAELSPDKGALLHAAGLDTRGDLAGHLERAGFTLRLEILYDAIAASALPQIAYDALTSRLDGALFFSPRTAAIFAALVQQGNLAACCERVRAFCISEATAAALRGLPFLSIEVASRPNEDALLALLG